MSGRRQVTAVLIGILALSACGLPSRDEVAKVTSPDGSLVAVLIETNGGATTSFGYEIWLRDKNAGSGEQVGTLHGAVRNDDAFGANLRWTDNTELSVEYLKAQTERLVLTSSSRYAHS